MLFLLRSDKRARCGVIRRSPLEVRCLWKLPKAMFVLRTGPTERLEDQEKDGKMTLTNSSNKNLKKLKTQSKAAIKPTKLGST